MNILILGSTGFLGSALKILLDNTENNIISLKHKNIFSDKNVLDIFRNVDVIINCVGSASVGNSFIDSQNDFQSNVIFVQNVLEFIKINNFIKIKFVNLSSAAVYGNPEKLPIVEMNPLRPLSPYGFNKMLAEQILKEYSIFFGLKTLSLRLFSAYGVGQRKLLFWDLHEKINSEGAEIVLKGTGLESRDYIHVNDIAQQILISIKLADFNGEAINVANGQEIQVRDVLKLFQKYYPRKFKFIFNGEVRLGDPTNWCADISIMKSWGYNKSVDFEDGIKSYIESIIE